MFTRARHGWRPVPQGAPAGLVPWLTDHDSLTAAVRVRCGDFRVEVLRQGLDRALPDEAALLGVRPGTRVWVREVALMADGVPWVWARSVARRSDLRTAWRDLAGLGNRSLGAALFADPLVGRGKLLVRPLSRRDPRGRAALLRFGAPPAATLWARRSLFCRGQGHILVTEVFEPGVPRR
ncbi:MAG: chorismate lyase [Rhodocyclaceae bacterium]|nr:chorismate lyase [Rhodocyclaceae bacterium]